MNNNKLYNENQVEEMLIKARFHNMDDSEMFTNEYLISQHTPIELPTDEEIDKTAVEFAKKYRATTYEISAFIIGAKYIIDKIKGGNNEQQ